MAPTDLILFVDAFDTLLLKDLGYLLKNPTVLDQVVRGHRVIFSGEKNCWPFAHRDVTDEDLERRQCMRGRKCPLSDDR